MSSHGGRAEGNRSQTQGCSTHRFFQTSDQVMRYGGEAQGARPVARTRVRKTAHGRAFNVSREHGAVIHLRQFCCYRLHRLLYHFQNLLDLDIDEARKGYEKKQACISEDSLSIVRCTTATLAGAFAGSLRSKPRRHVLSEAPAERRLQRGTV